MTSPLADEEELLRLVADGLSQVQIARVKNVSKQAVARRLKNLAPLMEARGIQLSYSRQPKWGDWIPWPLGQTHWRNHYVIKMLRLLGRKFEGRALDESEQARLDRFIAALDDMPELPGGRGVVTYRGPDEGVRIVPRRPWDRGYIRWPEGVEDTRLMPPKLVMPDEPYMDEHELKIAALTDLPASERHARIIRLREARSNRDRVDMPRQAEAG